MKRPNSPFFLTRRLVAVATALSLSGAAWAVPDTQFIPLFEQFNVINHGDDSKLDQVAKGFETLLKSEPTNPVLLAYVGTTTAMKATTTLLPWKKMSFAEDGMAQLDKALAMLTSAHDVHIQHGTPGSLEVKFLAAKTFLAVPSFMNKGARGAKLLSEITASPLLGNAPTGFQGDVWFTTGELALSQKRPEDARKAFAKVVELKAPQADAARSQLGKLGS